MIAFRPCKSQTHLFVRSNPPVMASMAHTLRAKHGLVRDSCCGAGTSNSIIFTLKSHRFDFVGYVKFEDPSASTGTMVMYYGYSTMADLTGTNKSFRCLSHVVCLLYFGFLCVCL